LIREGAARVSGRSLSRALAAPGRRSQSSSRRRKEKLMKEVEKKDVPEVSGGQSSVSPLPGIVTPYPIAFPQAPGGPGPFIPVGPTDPTTDPLGDALKKITYQP